ncbi:MAG: diacylglycerol kinase family lipid kinase [Planctomycetes bacterium]|nr:diacylglycerol kinase family lipid kinase [Planctomycetota bacterium]
MRLKIIVNPISGSGRSMRFLERLKDALVKEQIDCQVAPTQKAGDATRIAAEHQDNTSILCLGGDGTLNEVINGLLSNTKFNTDTRPTLGFIPFGSGNVIAKELGLKRNIRQFIHLFRNNLSRQLDLGCVTLPKENLRRYFISMTGIGFDAQVAQKYHLSRKDGSRLQAHLFSYFPIALRHLFSYQAPRINILADGKPLAENASFVQVANVRSYGGPFVLVNQAIHNDGALDACWFTGKSSLSILLYYTLAFLGNGSLASAGHQRVNKVVVTSQETVALQVDGDFCGYLPAEIEIVPQAVRMFTPTPMP